MKATRDSGEPYFVIRDEQNGGQEYCLRPETLDDYKKWAGVLAESVRSDEDFQAAKLAPVLIQAEAKRV